MTLGSGITAGVAASIADLVPNGTPDAALLALCPKAETADRLMMEANRQHDLLRGQGREAEWKAVQRECDDRFDEFVDHAEKAALIPALTVEGMRAKARLLYLNLNATLEDGELTALILRDIGWGA